MQRGSILLKLKVGLFSVKKNVGEVTFLLLCILLDDALYLYQIW